jgi:hypothetical protein
MIQRSRLYAEAVKRHDAQLERRKGILATVNSNGLFLLKLANYNN